MNKIVAVHSMGVYTSKRINNKHCLPSKRKPPVSFSVLEKLYLIPQDYLLTFDDGLADLWENREIFKTRHGTPTAVLFVIGNLIGESGHCSKDQLDILVEDYGCELGWHTWNHPDLTYIPALAKREIPPPFPMRYFAYPFGKFNFDIIELVKGAGFEKAFTLDYRCGDDTDFQINRTPIEAMGIYL